MIVTLNIRKSSGSQYLAQLLAGGKELTVDTPYANLSDAIRAEAWCLTEDTARVVEVRYAGLSGGTWHTRELADQADPLSARLTELAEALA